MRSGVSHATGKVFWFLHADTGLDEARLPLLLDRVGRKQHAWGFFPVRMNSDRPVLRLVAAMMNIRSRLTRIATGDQGIFVERQLYEESGGFQAIELMEDIDLCRRLKRKQVPRIGALAVTISSRKWDKEGVMRTILLMWRLRFLFWLGVDTGKLAETYYRRR
jgi:hypothetical protein